MAKAKTRRSYKNDAKAELKECFSSPLYVVNLTNRERKHLKALDAFYTKCGIETMHLDYLCKDTRGLFCTLRPVSATMADTLADLFSVGTNSIMKLHTGEFICKGGKYYHLRPINGQYSMQILMDSVDDAMTIAELPTLVEKVEKKMTKKEQKAAIIDLMKKGEICPEDAVTRLAAI